MGAEWRKLLKIGALYVLLVLAFPALLAMVLLVRGRGPEGGLWDLSLFLVTQGWGMVSLLLAAQLGSTIWQREDRGAWEYLATLPHDGLRLLWGKLLPRLTTLLAWGAGFALLKCLPLTLPSVISEVGLPVLFSHPAQVLVFSLSWFLPSSLLTLIRETDNLKRQLFGWFGMTSLYLWVWLLGTLQKHRSIDLFRLDKEAMLSLLDLPGLASLALFALVAALPLCWIACKAIRPLTLTTPSRFLTLFQRFGLPFYALSWIWFIGAILTGGVR